MSEYYQSHCCLPSSASRCTNLTGTSSRPRCGSPAAGARSQPPTPGSAGGSCRSACFRSPAVTAPASGGRKPGGSFCAAPLLINDQPRKFRLLYQN